MRWALCGSRAISACMLCRGLAWPFLSVSSKVKPMPSTYAPTKHCPSLAARGAGSRSTAPGNRNAEMRATGVPARWLAGGGWLSRRHTWTQRVCTAAAPSQFALAEA